MRPIRSILVPVSNYSARSLAFVNKAAQLATVLNAGLELFHDLANPMLVEGLGESRNALRESKASFLRPVTKGLERLAAPLRANGLKVSIGTAWDYPPHEAILRRAVAIGADLIVAPCRDRHRLPGLLAYTDWELLRLSPLPVLLVKSPKLYRRPTVLAAIDPTHAHAKPSALDQRILDYGAQVGRALRGALHVVHVYMPRPLPPSVTFDIRLRDSLHADAEREARQILSGALTQKSIPTSRRHLVRGDPVAAIPATSRKTHSAIVVIGAVSRSGLRRLFIGNTAEKVLDELRCDLLVVKPARFTLKGQRGVRHRTD
jgi:universal stress protein E